jgi:hypothetical protein
MLTLPSPIRSFPRAPFSSFRGPASRFCHLADDTGFRPAEGFDESPLATDVPDSTARKVFVLGTPHLSAFSDRFEPSMVDSLITLLDRFGPDAIGIEKIPGRQAAAMERWGATGTRLCSSLQETSCITATRSNGRPDGAGARPTAAPTRSLPVPGRRDPGSEWTRGCC